MKEDNREAKLEVTRNEKKWVWVNGFQNWAFNKGL